MDKNEYILEKAAEIFQSEEKVNLFYQTMSIKRKELQGLTKDADSEIKKAVKEYFEI